MLGLVSWYCDVNGVITLFICLGPMNKPIHFQSHRVSLCQKKAFIVIKSAIFCAALKNERSFRLINVRFKPSSSPFARKYRQIVISCLDKMRRANPLKSIGALNQILHACPDEFMNNLSNGIISFSNWVHCRLILLHLGFYQGCTCFSDYKYVSWISGEYADAQKMTKL